jgi:ribonuclease HI
MLANSHSNIAERLPGPRQTNQRAELLALKRALDIVPMNSHVLVFSDSNYAIKCVTEWFRNWEKRGWTTSGKKAVENKDLIEDILAVIRNREKCRAKTTFQWVKGHSDNEGNNGADALAVKGSQLPMPVDGELEE